MPKLLLGMPDVARIGLVCACLGAQVVELELELELVKRETELTTQPVEPVAQRILPHMLRLASEVWHRRVFEWAAAMVGRVLAEHVSLGDQILNHGTFDALSNRFLFLFLK